MNNNIEIKNELRPCLVKGAKALFHKWVDYQKPVPGGITPIDPPPGQIKCTFGLVEYENGQVEEVSPNKIEFCDNKIKEYAFDEFKETKEGE